LETEDIILSEKFSFPKNTHALALYSGMMGAILENDSNQNWYYHETLNDIALWLKNNNLFLSHKIILSYILIKMAQE
jgi:hypothetical protein